VEITTRWVWGDRAPSRRRLTEVGGGAFNVAAIFQLFPKNNAFLSIFWSKFLLKIRFLNDCKVQFLILFWLLNGLVRNCGFIGVWNFIVFKLLKGCWIIYDCKVCWYAPKGLRSELYALLLYATVCKFLYSISN